MTIQLQPGEVILKDGGASHVKGIETVGGHLWLTNLRLFFESHALNFQTHAVSYPLSDIVSLQPHGMVPTWMYVTLKTGQQEKFVIFGRDEWLARIAGALREAVPAAMPAATLAAMPLSPAPAPTGSESPGSPASAGEPLLPPVPPAPSPVNMSSAPPSYTPPAGAYQAPAAVAPAAVAPSTHGLAIVSLVSGILGLLGACPGLCALVITPALGLGVASACTGLGGLVALVCGYLARKTIRAEAGRYSGEGLAKAGIILGWIGVGLAALALCGMVAVLAGLLALLGISSYSGSHSLVPLLLKLVV